MLGAITGSIAEAAYGVPEAIGDKAISLLDDTLLEVYYRWRERISLMQRAFMHRNRSIGMM